MVNYVLFFQEEREWDMEEKDKAIRILEALEKGNAPISFHWNDAEKIAEVIAREIKAIQQEEERK